MSRLSLILVFAMHGAGVLCLLSGFWTCLWAPIVMGLGVQVWNAPDYRPAVFVVESTSYYSGDVQSPDVNPTAEGKVEGQTESLALGALLERAPRDAADLAALVPPGRQFKVLHNPRVPRAAFQDLRVLPYAEDFARRAREKLVRFTLLGYGPLLVLLPLTLILALLLRRVGADNPGPRGQPFPTGAAMAWLYLGMPLLMLGMQTLFAALALWVAR